MDADKFKEENGLDEDRWAFWPDKKKNNSRTFLEACKLSLVDLGWMIIKFWVALLFLTWSKRIQLYLSCRYVSNSCNLSIEEIYSIFVILWIGFFVVAVYLDNVLKNEVGLRKWVHFAQNNQPDLHTFM